MYFMLMENEEDKQKPVPYNELLDDLIDDGSKLKQQRLTLILRVIGFVMILFAFGILLLWRNGVANPMFRSIALGIGIAGFIIYFSSRLFEIIYPKVKKRKRA